MSSDRDSFASLTQLLEKTGLSYAVIGAYAVNVWLEPRFTADIDIVIQAEQEHLVALKDALAEKGFTQAEEMPVNSPSGPDFIRFSSDQDVLSLEVQISKMDYQEEVIRRSRSVDGLKIATPEDLIVMKLIADRPKDHIDLQGLIQLPDIDWPYIEKWASEWEINDRLSRVRGTRG